MGIFSIPKCNLLLNNKKRSKTMSRVMSRVIIYLGRLSPIASSDQPETSGPHTFPFGLASDGVYRDPCCYQQSGGLLHHLSTLTDGKSRSGIFLLHFPWSHLHRTLSGILPCEARTFLTCCLSALTAAITCLTCIFKSVFYYSTIQQKSQTFFRF